MTKTFIIVGNKAVTAPFSLNDLAGAAGRMDLLCRSIGSSFFLSHDIRRDVRSYLVLMGGPDPPTSLSFDGSRLRYMSPDERNIGGLIRKALGQGAIGPGWIDSTPGIMVSRMDLPALLDRVTDNTGSRRYYLVEDGAPIEDITFDKDQTFLLGDHMGLAKEHEDTLSDWTRLSLGKKSYHTDHCITVLNHILDERGL